jgi:hypothetical protein
MPRKQRIDRKGNSVGKGKPVGDCFLICNLEGKWWTGSTWSAYRKEAARFQAEPDPARAAYDQLDTLLAKGERCCVLYLPSHLLRLFFAGNGLSGVG